MSSVAEQDETTISSTIVVITERAANKSKAALANAADKTGIRISVTGGGCAGLQYGLKPDTVEKTDHVLEFHGVLFYINPMVVPYIKGMTIDYSDDLMDGGFKFINPNATNSCGCGTSFGV
ncbi:MAG: iron-sulfur cluster assembly accessory protein [Cyanobacteria bacterium P01_H01_bin.74]